VWVLGLFLRGFQAMGSVYGLFSECWSLKTDGLG